MCCPCSTRCNTLLTGSPLPTACGSISLGGDLGINDAELRQALHARGILTVGIPTTVEPINPAKP